MYGELEIVTKMIKITTVWQRGWAFGALLERVLQKMKLGIIMTTKYYGLKN